MSWRPNQKRSGVLETPLALLDLPRVGEYARRFTAARMEQDIYRTALRNYGNRDPIDIHLFCPRKQELALLLERFPSAKHVSIDAAPPYFDEGKALSRSYMGGKTHFAQLDELLRSGLTLPMKVSEIKGRMGLGNNAWNDLMAQERTHKLLDGYGIKRVGRGRNATWECVKAA